MAFGIMIGADLLIGTNGVMVVETDSGPKEFFRIREIDRARSGGSYLVVDCDVKDAHGNREVKLFKSKPVAGSADVNIEKGTGFIELTRTDGSRIIRVEEVSKDDPSLPSSGPVQEYLPQLDGVLRITGEFVVGAHQVCATKDATRIDNLHLSGNVMIGTGGIRLRASGFAL